MKWTPEYLASVCGRTPIPVSHYPDGATLAGKIKMTVESYLNAISTTPESWNNYYMEAVELSGLSEELCRDAPIPAELDDLPDIADTVFFGRNTGSCCHIHAHEEAIVFQLMGTKVFSLYHPNDVRNLYFEPISRDYRRSRIDFDNIDYQQFPRARYLKRIDVTLRPGDCALPSGSLGALDGGRGLYIHAHAVLHRAASALSLPLAGSAMRAREDASIGPREVVDQRRHEENDHAAAGFNRIRGVLR